MYCVLQPLLAAGNKKPSLNYGNFLLLIISSVFIAAAGYIINDYFDMNIDRINKPDRLIVQKYIKRRWTIVWHFFLSMAGVAIGFYLDLTTRVTLLGFSNLICACLLFIYSISLKRKLRKAEIWSCDISKEALHIANRNANNLNADVKFIQLDFLHLEERNNLPVFDIIVSNPPYVPQKDKEQMDPNVLNFEPHVALFVPDNDPLKFYKAIAEFGKEHLDKKGSIFLELHEVYAEQTAEFYEREHYKIELKRDMQGKNRMLHANGR